MNGRATTCGVRALAAVLGLFVALGAAFFAAPADAQTVSITSTPANGTHYVRGEAITTRISLSQSINGVLGGAFTDNRMSIDIGGTTRQASPSGTCCGGITSVGFSYTVQRDDVDTDGITIPANSISGPSWVQTGFVTVNRNHTALSNQASHKVIGSAASVSSTSPASLHSENLDGATLSLSLTGTTFGSSVTASDFTVTGLTGLSVSGVSGVTSGGTTATLTLSWSGGSITSDQTFAVTVDDTAHAGGIDLTTGTVTVSFLATVTLALDPASVSENGGVSTVTATLDAASSQATTVTVAAAAGANAVTGDFTQTGTTLTIAAGATTSTGTVTITAVNDTTDGPDKSVTVSGTVTGGLATAPSAVTLAITDDDGAPTVTLRLSSASVSENGGVSTVTATLSHPSSQATTVTVATAAGAGTTAGDFTRTGTTLTIAAGATTSTGTVTITAVNDTTDGPNKSVTVSGTASNGQGVANPSAVTLAIIDDDGAPTVVLRLSSASVSENGGVSTVTATLSHPSNQATTVTVATAAGSGTTAEHFTQSGTTLTIAAGATTSTGTVTITAVNDTIDGPNKSVTVSGTASNSDGVENPSAVTLAITDDDGAPTVTLRLSSASVSENGGVSTVTATLSHPSNQATTVTVATAAGAGTTAEHFTQSGSTLTIAAGATTSTGAVTITAVNDTTDGPDKSVTVSGTASNSDGVENPSAVTLAITDDDGAPTVTLRLSSASVSENGGVSTVTAALSHPSSRATTVMVATAAGAGTTAGDFTQSGTTLTIAAGATTSTGTVTITAVNDTTDGPNKSVTVSGTASNSQGVVSPVAVTLTITDDDEKGLAFARAGVPDFPGFLDVTAGEEQAYTATLTSMPSGPVTLAVAVSPASRTDVSVRPNAFTFTPSDWNTARTVTVRVPAAAGGYVRPLALVHRASGGGYEAVERLDVSVRGETKLRVGPGIPETHVVVNGRRVRVEVADDVPAGLEVDLAGLPRPTPGTEALGLRFTAEVAESAVMRVSADGFGVGPEASRTVVDVAIVSGDVPSPGLRLCLPVEDGVRREARGRPLLLLHYDGSSWRAVAGSVEVESGDRALVCASGVSSFSPFAVGYEDRPVFAGDFPETLTFTVDEAIEPVTLPPVREGTGDGEIEYALTPALPAGLMLIREGRVLSGTPTVESDGTIYTWTATDVDGQEVELTFTIEVVAAVAPARARLEALNESILPELSRASWDSAMEAVSRRLESPTGGGGEALSAALVGFVQAHEQGAEAGGGSWKGLLSGRSFAVDLGGGEGAGAGVGRSVTVWGTGDRRSLSRDTDSLDWSGELLAAHLGADAGFGSGLTGGVGVSWFKSEMDYVDRSGEEPVEGEHRSRMASVQPYVGWSSEGGSRLWGALGYGSGEVEVVDQALRERFGRQESDSKLLGVAVGGAMRLASAGAARVDLKGEGHATRYEVEDNGALIAGLSVETQRVRVSAEGSREYALSDGARLAPSAEVGVRWDGGDGATGTGVEVGGGLSWNDAGGRLTLEARGRALVAHRGDLDEWGLSGGVRLEPDASGRGLSLNVQPQWGDAGNGAARLWEEGMAAGRGSAEAHSGAGLEAELGYGLAAFDGFGVATPYARLGLGQEKHRYGLGWRLDRPSDAFALDLETWRRERGMDRPEHGVAVTLGVRW